ncbi:hypothetical protein [Bacillus haynesii]|uniref:hypothetical protein n=1 Tax=Bacillus haynesii TaxID=1925021 RepID=UPI002E111010
MVDHLQTRLDVELITNWAIWLYRIEYEPSLSNASPWYKLSKITTMISIRMFADVENFATKIGHYFYHQRNLKLSNEYYRISIGAKRKLRKERL